MKKEFKIYHTETQEDYDDLMIELEKQGYRWLTGEKLSSANGWIGSEEETSIHLNKYKDYTVTHGFISTAKENYPDINIIKYKAQGVERMEKVVVPQFVADWYEDFRYKSLRLVLNHLMSCKDQHIMEWVDKNSPRSAQEIIAKMHLFKDYEVEEEKKYLWRKKKEYMFEFEEQSYAYMNVDKETQQVLFHNKTETKLVRTLLSETEVKQLVSEEDFNKLEKVEIADDEC